jgi:hypothetical protein
MKIRYLMLVFPLLLLAAGELAGRPRNGYGYMASPPNPPAELYQAPSRYQKIETLDEQIEKFGEECDAEAVYADPDCLEAAKLVEEKSKLIGESEPEIEEIEDIEIAG